MESESLSGAQNLEQLDAGGRIADRGPESVARAPRRVTLEQEVEKIRSEYHSALHRIQAEYDPEFDPDRPVPPIDYQRMQKLIPTDIPTAVIHYSLTQERGVALILTAERIEAIPMPELNDGKGIELAQAWFDG